MGYNHLFEWGTTLEDLIYTLCLPDPNLPSTETTTGSLSDVINSHRDSTCALRASLSSLNGSTESTTRSGGRNDMAVILRRDSGLSHVYRSDPLHGDEMKWGGGGGEWRELRPGRHRDPFRYTKNPLQPTQGHRPTPLAPAGVPGR